MRIRLLVALALALCAAGALAQEFEIFDANDFIDPRERGAVFSNGKMESPGRPFTVMRFYTGGVRDYQWRDTPTGANLVFAHVTWSRYSGKDQINVKVTGYGVDSSSNLPRYRGTLQFARYLVIPDGKDGARAAGRLLISGSLDENPSRQVAACTNTPRISPAVNFCAGFPTSTNNEVSSRAFNRSFAVALDTYVALPFAGKDLAATGSFVWSRRIIETGRYSDRLLYYYRGPYTDLAPNVRLTMDMSAGGERTAGWHSAYRGVAKVAWDIPGYAGKRFGTLNVAYAPTLLPGQHPHHWYNEVGLYFDRTIFARLGK